MKLNELADNSIDVGSEVRTLVAKGGVGRDRIGVVDKFVDGKAWVKFPRRGGWYPYEMSEIAKTELS